jgi:hypothetical protein
MASSAGLIEHDAWQSAGVAAYLPKPVAQADLFAAILTHLCHLLPPFLA